MTGIGGRQVWLFFLVLVAAGANPGLLADTAPPPLEQEFFIDLGLNPDPDPGVRRISLAEALDIAFADNIDLALVRAEEQIARGRRLSSRGALLPSLQIGFRSGRKDGRVQGSFGALQDVTFSTDEAGAALVYRNNLGARLHQALAERKSVEAAELLSLRAEQRLLVRVTDMYQSLMLAHAAVRIADQLVEDSEKFLTIARVRAEGGLGLGSDVTRAQAKLAADELDRIQVRNLRDEIGRQLAVTLRLDPARRLEPAERRLAPSTFLSREEAADHFLDAAGDRPDVMATRRQADAAKSQLSAARWELFGPDLLADLGHFEIGLSASDLEGRDERQALLLWTFSPQEVGQLQERRAEKEAAKLRMHESEDRAQLEILNAGQDLEAARAQLPHARTGMEAARDNLRLSQARFQAGTAIALEVLDAENVLAQARLDLARAITGYNLAQLNLLGATGKIDRSHILGLQEATPPTRP